MIRLSERHSITNVSANNIIKTVPQPQHHITSAKGSSSASLVLVYGFLSVLILGSKYGDISMVKRDGWHTWDPARLNSLCYCATRFSMSVSVKSFHVVCPIIKLFCSFEYEQGWVNESVSNLSHMNAYVHVQLLSHTNTCIIAENPITVRRSWSEFDALMLAFGSQVFPHMLASVRLRRLTREWGFLATDSLTRISGCFLLDHTNMHNCLGNCLGDDQLTRCRGCGLSQIVDVETFLMNFKYVVLSPDETKHCQCSSTRIEKKEDQNCWGLLALILMWRTPE